MRRKILVTAFGPFGGRTLNASSLALAELKKRLPFLNTRILPVDSVLAPRLLTRALREVDPDAVVLLGEAGGSTTIRLETTAWNELDFRIPDIRGRQPQKLPIHPSAPASLASTLPLETIHKVLLEAGHEISLSTDAGRYLCNQLLFHALRLMGSTIPTGFIHLPLEQDYATEKAAKALEAAIQVILRTGNTAGPSAGRRAARSGVRGRRR